MPSWSFAPGECGPGAFPWGVEEAERAGYLALEALLRHTELGRWDGSHVQWQEAPEPPPDLPPAGLDDLLKRAPCPCRYPWGRSSSKRGETHSKTAQTIAYAACAWGRGAVLDGTGVCALSSPSRTVSRRNARAPHAPISSRLFTRARARGSRRGGSPAHTPRNSTSLASGHPSSRKARRSTKCPHVVFATWDTRNRVRRRLFGGPRRGESRGGVLSQASRLGRSDLARRHASPGPPPRVRPGPSGAPDHPPPSESWTDASHAP